MIIEILKRSMIGIAFGGIYTFIALTIMKFNHMEGTISEIWTHMLASFILGIYFGVSSLIYENEGWSPLKRTITHFILSIIIYFIIAIPIGWIPSHPLAIILSIFIFIGIYSLYWTGYFLYFKNIEVSMNKHFQENNDDEVIN